MQPLFPESLGGTGLGSSSSRSALPHFGAIAPEETNRWPSFILSFALHALALLLVPTAGQFFTAQTDHEIAVRQQRIVKTLHIRIPEDLYLTSTGSASPSSVPKRKQITVFNVSPALASKVSGAGKGVERKAESARALLRQQRAARRSAARRRRFQLPPLPPRPEFAQTMLQPQFPADMLPPRLPNLPEVLFWAPQPEVPRMLKPFVMPGYAQRPAQPRLLDAEPRLEKPMGERVPLNVPPLPDSASAALLLAPPPALPIRTAEADAGPPRTGISADMQPGDPIAVLSMTLTPSRLREFLAVPPGNVLGEQPGSAGSSGQGGTGKDQSQGDAAGASAGHDSVTEHAGAVGQALPDSVTALNTPLPASSRPEIQSASTSPPGTSPKEITTRSANASSNPVPEQALSRRTAALAAAAATRIVHPTTGVFDVVVQSGGLEGFLESAGVLSGRPVYSAYVHVGGSKDWILQYCIPASDEPPAQQSGAVVTLSGPGPLSAPYPYVTMRPPLKAAGGRHLMVHGFITPSGRFQELKVLGKTEAADADSIVAVLEQWEFRPASRDGRAVRVEVLLAIPTE